MGQSVGGFRDRFYRDLIEDYQERQTQSSLYRFFWRESMEGLLKESLSRLLSKSPVPGESLSELLARDFPGLLSEEDLCPEGGARIIEQLSGEMKKPPRRPGFCWSPGTRKNAGTFGRSSS